MDTYAQYVFDAFKATSKEPEFRIYVRKVFESIKELINAPYSEIIEWLNSECRIETSRGIVHSGKLYELSFPCWYRSFRKQYLFDNLENDPDEFPLVHIMEDRIVIKKFDADQITITVSNFLIALRHDFEETNKIMLDILGK